MTISWDDLSADELRSLAAALRSGRLAPKPSALALQRHCADDRAAWLASTLESMAVDAPALATFLELLATERERVAAAAGAIELVWSGPEHPGLTNRDTGAVVRELFASARESVLVVGYAIHRGHEIFRLLADRMDREPELRVRFIVDVRRGYGDTTRDADLIQRFANDFRDNQWPGKRLPEVYFDPRSLALDPRERSAMHAKCVVIDEQVALITSANFTSAAQMKNIEVGVRLAAPSLATTLVERIHGLVGKGDLSKVEIRWHGA